MQNTDNQELQRKFEKKQSYFNEMQRISRKFLQFQQLVYYSPLKDINPSMITRLELSHEGRRGHPPRKEEVYVINGQYQPAGPKSFEKLVLQIVQTIPRPKSSFGLIYINTLADGEAYNDFKKVLELLPVQYLLNLTKIYIVEATFLNKAFSCFSFGTNPSYVKNKTVNVDTLEQLSFKSQIELEVIKKHLPKNIVQSFQRRQESAEVAGHKPHGMCMNEQVDYYESRKKLPPSIQASIVPPGFSRNKSQDLAFESHQQKELLSTSSSTVKLGTENSKRLIDQYEVGPSGAPKALEMLIYFFNNNQQYLRVQGIFRKSVSIDDETQILRQINNKNYNYLATVDNPHLIANAIKRFLSNFRQPIIPYDMFQTFMSYDTHPQYRSFVVQKVKQLPKTNRMIIFILFDFLRTSIIPNSDANKMGENNLCIIFGPVLMRSEVISIKDLIYAKKIIQVASYIFQDFQLIFGDRLAQLKIKRSSYKQYMKTQIKTRSSKELPQKQQQLIQPTQSPQKQEINEQAPITPTFNIIHHTSQFIKEALQSNESDGDQLDPQFPQPQPQHPKNIHVNPDSIKQPFQQQASNYQEPVNLFVSMKVQNPGHQQALPNNPLLLSQEALAGEEEAFR